MNDGIPIRVTFIETGNSYGVYMTDRGYWLSTGLFDGFLVERDILPLLEADGTVTVEREAGPEFAPVTAEELEYSQ